MIIQNYRDVFHWEKLKLDLEGRTRLGKCVDTC